MGGGSGGGGRGGRGSDGGGSKWGRIAKFAALGVVGLLILLAAFGSFRNPEAGSIGVVRNGGPLDDKKIRGIIQPASGLHWVGVYSSVHYYPANQRNYIITSDPARGDRTGVDIFRTPTRDAVNVGVEGQVLFTVNVDDATLRTFDTRYGTRTNPSANHDGERFFPWDGDLGWGAFLDSWFRPTLDNALREEIAQFNCEELNASCSLVKGTNSGSVQTNVNLVKIQEALEKSLQRDLNLTLGDDYIEIQKVNIVGIKLPDTVEVAVDTANAEKARVAGERYKAQQAKYKARAALAQARANRANPYAGIEQVFKAMPADSQPVINVNLGGGSSKGLNLGFNR